MILVNSFFYEKLKISIEQGNERFSYLTENPTQIFNNLYKRMIDNIIGHLTQGDDIEPWSDDRIAEFIVTNKLKIMALYFFPKI